RISETDTIVLVFDRRGPEALTHRNWKLTACEKLSGFSRKRRQVRLGQGGNQTVALREVQRAADVETEKAAEEAERRGPVGRGDHARVVGSVCPAHSETARASRNELRDTSGATSSDPELEAPGGVDGRQVDADGTN